MITQTHIISSPVGNLGITVKNYKLIRLDLFANSAQYKIPESLYCQHVTAELAAYFLNPQHTFSLDLELTGSEFQQTVWWTLRNIRPGETVTYGDLARKLNTSARAIGQACRTNPIPIIVPCHRVIGAHSAGGYVGQTSGYLHDIKKFLLAHEK